MIAEIRTQYFDDPRHSPHDPMEHILPNAQNQAVTYGNNESFQDLANAASPELAQLFDTLENQLDRLCNFSVRKVPTRTTIIPS